MDQSERLKDSLIDYIYYHAKRNKDELLLPLGNQDKIIKMAMDLIKELELQTCQSLVEAGDN